MKRLKLLIFLFAIIFPISIHAADVEYTLFDSNLTVNKDRTVDIVENYNLYYINDTDKITRILNPNILEIRPDQSNLLIPSKISNINSDNDIKIEEKDKLKRIIIPVEGYQDEVGELSLSYQFNLGKDNSNKYDEFYYDIASNVNATISNLTFTIHMPNGYDKTKVKFSIDGKYNLSDDDLEVSYEDNQITGVLNKLLEEGQTFSVRIELNNGYFVGASDNFNYFNILYLVIPFVTIIVLIIYWWKNGKGNKVLWNQKDEIVNQFDPAEVGYLYKGKCEERDLIANLIFLANQGYIRIEENDDGYKLGKENSFRFIKLKEYDKNNGTEKIIFEQLFRENDIAELENIEYHFAETFMEAKHMLDNEDNYKKLYIKSMKTKKIISLVLIILSIVNIQLVAFNREYLWWVISSVSLTIGFYVLIVSNTTIVMKLIFGFGTVAGTLYLVIRSILLQPKLIVIYSIGFILTFFATKVYTKLPDRTKYGNKLLGNSYALKQYLETITNSELKSRLEKNENYFYDMVPYAAVLDCLDVWISKGKEIIETAPDWYIPAEEFKLKKFEKFIQNVLYTTALVMLKQSYSELGINIEYSQDKVKTNLND